MQPLFTKRKSAKLAVLPVAASPRITGRISRSSLITLTMVSALVPLANARALTYNGVTAVLANNADTIAQVNAACVAAWGATSRAARINELMMLGEQVSIAAANVYGTRIMATLADPGGSGYPVTVHFVDGVALDVNIGSSPIQDCTTSTSATRYNSQYSSASGIFTSNPGSRCSTANAWHCVSGNLSGGAGDNLGNHTATQALNMGGFAVNSASGYFHGSDQNLKTDIKAVSGLEILKHLTGVSYNWKKDGHPAMGVIAQEMEKVMPQAVMTDPQTGLKSVEYDQLIAPLIQAIKELDAKNDALEEDVRALQEDRGASKGEQIEARP